MTKELVLEALKGVKYPGFEKDIVAFGFVKDVEVSGENVLLDVEIVSASPEVAEELRGAITACLTKAGAARVDVTIKQPKPPAQKATPSQVKTSPHT